MKCIPWELSGSLGSVTGVEPFSTHLLALNQSQLVRLIGGFRSVASGEWVAVVTQRLLELFDSGRG